ncbi:MAG: DUF302 domain-containing protein [Anaerolineaceae bacterium]|nr:DUF302 domain-containing protein [Anaerolineaceae bacterium]
MEEITGSNGIISLPSPYPVDETINRVEAAVRAKGMLIFLRLDQRLEAEKVGLKMRPAVLLLFGNPKAGTILMNASQGVAIDLPLKALAWQDSAGKVWVSYNSPQYLKLRHQLSDELISLVAGAGNIISEAIR